MKRRLRAGSPGLRGRPLRPRAADAAARARAPSRLTGAQVLVAWALQRADPGTKLSMVAEEDSASLK